MQRIAIFAFDIVFTATLFVILLVLLLVLFPIYAAAGAVWLCALVHGRKPPGWTERVFAWFQVTAVPTPDV